MSVITNAVAAMEHLGELSDNSRILVRFTSLTCSDEGETGFSSDSEY